MNKATPQMRAFAKRLMDAEAQSHAASAATLPAVSTVTDMLRPHLATLMGNGGFRALLSRALALSKAEIPWLGAVRVAADGGLNGLETPHSQLQATEFDEGCVVLVAQLLGLLVAFIGLGLTLRLVGEVWPGIAEEKDGGSE